MKKKIEVIISISLIIVWMIVIYNFSAMDSFNSNKKSKKVINKIVESEVVQKELNSDVTNDKQNTNSNVINLDNNSVKENKNSKKKKSEVEIRNEKMVNDLNLPLRKCAHASVYLVLSLLILNFLFICFKNKKIFNAFIAVFISFLYACTDEYHQLFVEGRTGQFIDVLIDSLGAVGGVVIFYLGYFIINYFKSIKNNKMV